MIEPVTKDRWLEAQAAEIRVVSYDLVNSRRAYQHIFDYLGMSTDQSGKTIIEIGCGPFPAAMFCRGIKAIVYEPLFAKPSHCAEDILWHQLPFEWEEAEFKVDEAWLFNVLQHVIDPELLIAKCKERARVIRYFEPVDYPTCVYHPHTFSQADFERWFPHSVKRYTDRLPAFFDADCVYGTYHAR